MEKSILAFIEKHQLLHKRAKVLVGVSGGADSLALLAFLRSIQKVWELEIVVLSVEHGLRGAESVADYDYVRKMAQEWGFSFQGTSVNVQRYVEQHKVSIEVAARELRYQFFASQMKAYQADYLALGHHGDDQIETLLMKLVRSGSSTAFTGIPVKRPFATGKIIRPLLAVSRNEIDDYCLKQRIEPRIDATNMETEHTRNYYRHLVVPLLKEKNSQLHRTAQHLSETLSEDEAYLQKQAEQVLKATTTLHLKEKKATIDLHLFLNYDYPLQRRAYKLILNYLYDERILNRLSYTHEGQFFQLIKEQAGHVQIDFPYGLKLSRSYQLLTFHFAHHEETYQAFDHRLDVPGSVTLPNGSIIRAFYTNEFEQDERYIFYIPENEGTLPLQVRTRKPGDRMSWDGLKGTKKIKDIFIDLKVPQAQRDAWPLIVDCEGNVLWLVGLKKADVANEKQTSWICLQYKKLNQLEDEDA